MKTFKKIQPEGVFQLDANTDYPALIRAKLDEFQRHAQRCVECSPRLEKSRRACGVVSILCPTGERLHVEAEQLRELERARHPPI